MQTHLTPVAIITCTWPGYGSDAITDMLTDRVAYGDQRLRIQAVELSATVRGKLSRPALDVDAVREWLYDNELEPIRVTFTGNVTGRQWAGKRSILIGQVTPTLPPLLNQW